MIHAQCHPVHQHAQALMSRKHTHTHTFGKVTNTFIFAIFQSNFSLFSTQTFERENFPGNYNLI